MKFLVTFRPNWWIIGAIFEEICIYVEENEGFGQPLIPFILLIGELQMGPYMVTYWCVSECCSLIGSHRLYVYRNVSTFAVAGIYLTSGDILCFRNVDISNSMAAPIGTMVGSDSEFEESNGHTSFRNNMFRYSRNMNLFVTLLQPVSEK